MQFACRETPNYFSNPILLRTSEARVIKVDSHVVDNNTLSFYLCVCVCFFFNNQKEAHGLCLYKTIVCQFHAISLG